ncbi:hypothetical protein R6Y95_06195 [Methanoculleus palmolei]|uniref:Phage major capsid protein n=1 Tax=Methanoculleus palmolei TaxID=72612 RepID=A0ABD8A7Q8_9EURY|nr:hypothetical protein R6Y95_06195 [Methanoculleus palmolei]
MYSKYRTLNQTLSLINTRIDLPRDAVIDQLLLKVAVTVANAGAGAYEGTNEAVLRAIQEIRVVSDGSTVHYALSAADIALLNAYNSKAGFAPALGGPVAIDAAGSATLTYYLRLDEGDILAASKDSLEAKIVVNPTIAADVTISALTCTVTLVENVLSPEEFIATYGANLEYAAEPKVYALSVPVTASTELTNVLDLPTGSLARAGMMQFINPVTGLAGSVDPTAIGLINTSPDRREVLHVDFPTLQAINMAEYDGGVIVPPATVPLPGVALLNYAKDVTNDGYGLRGWRFTKGDWQLAARTANAATLRYVCLEHTVNAAVFDQAERAVLERTR